MRTTTPGLVIICLDGARPDLVQAFDLFSPIFPVADTGVRRMRSVFPSSTASAHASFLTGVGPDGHGIVGNRFWNGEQVTEIFNRAENPLASLHPYEFGSLTAESWVQRLAGRGATSAAVQFPHTFDRAAEGSTIPAMYCLYAPSRCHKVKVGNSGGTPTAKVRTSYFGTVVTLVLELLQKGAASRLTIQSEHGSWTGDVPTDLQCQIGFRIPAGRVSAYCSWRQISAEDVELVITTAVLTLVFGGLDLLQHLDEASANPSSGSPSYVASGINDFFESPRAEWIRDAALETARIVRPDILLVRFNQIDHAQEFLYWQACRGSGAARRQARREIVETYDLVDQCVAELVESIGPDTDYLLFSDHGIATVDRHIGLNAVLGKSGFDREMTFQGDSHVAFLFADRDLTDRQATQLRSALMATDSSIEVLTDDDVGRLGLPSGSPRLGRLTITCGAHREFTYGPNDMPIADVQSASHGHVASDPDMDGMIRIFGPNALSVPVPDAIVSCAEAVEAIWTLRTAESR